jgi:hypothetical protein
MTPASATTPESSFLLGKTGRQIQNGTSDCLPHSILYSLQIIQSFYCTVYSVRPVTRYSVFLKPKLLFKFIRE